MAEVGDFDFKKREESAMDTSHTTSEAATEEKKEVVQSDVEKEIREEIQWTFCNYGSRARAMGHPIHK